jgi:transcriptional regulator with XRE-family HTH domain
MAKRENNEGAETPGAVFGELLKIKRMDAGLTQDEVAALVHTERSLITKFEAGQRVPRTEMVEKFDSYLAGRGELIRLHKKINWSVRLAYFPDWFRRRALMDALLLELREYQSVLIPGLLQTEAYARALFERVVGGDDEAAEDSVEARLSRQTRFLEPDGPFYLALLDEGCLWQVVGSDTVMRDQMDHLLEVGELPNIHIQVVRFRGRHTAAPNVPMSLITMPNQHRWVYSESLDMGHFSDNRNVIARHQRAYDLLRTDALSVRESAALISEARERYDAHD